MATPLSDLTRDCCPDKVVWEQHHQDAFEHLIVALSSCPVLRGPDYNKQFTLQTDASDRGIGAVLCQHDDEGQDRPVAFYSRKLLPRETNYAAVDQECLAIVDGVRHFQVYLTGVRFSVVTDHKCLEWLDSVKDAGGRRTRWSLLLQPFNFTIRHRPGTQNGNADGLSRQAWELGDDEEDTDKTSPMAYNRRRVEGSVMEPQTRNQRREKGEVKRERDRCPNEEETPMMSSDERHPH